MHDVLQFLNIELPDESPELQFGLKLYPNSTAEVEKLLYVHSITVEMEGLVAGVENLVIGSGGTVILK